MYHQRKEFIVARKMTITANERKEALWIMKSTYMDGAEASTCLNSLLREIMNPSEETVDIARDQGVDWSPEGLRKVGLFQLMRQIRRASFKMPYFLGLLTNSSEALLAMQVLTDYVAESKKPGAREPK